jgi:hypothetical protein
MAPGVSEGAAGSSFGLEASAALGDPGMVKLGAGTLDEPRLVVLI